MNVRKQEHPTCIRQTKDKAEGSQQGGLLGHAVPAGPEDVDICEGEDNPGLHDCTVHGLRAVGGYVVVLERVDLAVVDSQVADGFDFPVVVISEAEVVVLPCGPFEEGIYSGAC